MASAELDQVLRLFAAAPFDPERPVATARAGIDALGETFAPPPDVAIETVELGNRPAERSIARADGPVVLYLHGGGYVIGSPKSHRHATALLAQQIDGVVYSLDYRLAPEAPFPAAVEDATRALADLLGRNAPSKCAIAGDSAGGGLGFATLVAARDAGTAMPACMVGISPWVNLGTESASYDRLAGLDPVISRTVVEYFAPRYARERSRRDPLLSPLFANLEGLPPTLIQIGDRECFLGDAVAMHEALIAAGVDSELAVWKEMFHVWHLYWPMLNEGRAALDQAARFIVRHTATA